jgi:hypothetical protein
VKTKKKDDDDDDKMIIYHYCSVKGCTNIATDRFSRYCNECFIKIMNAFMDTKVLGLKQKRGFR